MSLTMSRRFFNVATVLAFLAIPTLATAATLKVSSFPSGAQVIIDGVNTGKTTPMNVSLTEGDHTVTVQIQGSGWNPDTRTVSIVAGNNDLSVTLLPTPTPGPPGTNGTNGTNGIDGTSVAFVDYFSGSQGGCPNGGAIYAAGNPPVNAYVCNGTNGIDGTNGTNGTGGTRADGPCFDNTNRYVDCGNGTVTDTVTGLIWLKDAACLGSTNYAAANGAAAALATGSCSLTDNSSPGDWRLPTKDEWSATIARAVAVGCRLGAGLPPSLTNDAGTGCLSAGPSSFAGVAPGNM